MKNHQSCPTCSLAIPEANVANNNSHKNSGHKWEEGRRRGRRRGRGHFGKKHFNGRNHSFKWNTNSYGRGRGRSQRANNYHVPQNNNSNQHNKWNEAGRSENNGTSCFRCESTNHWSKACRKAPHLCELYQASLKGKEKEVNHADNFDDLNAELNIADFDV
ncbi:uncharacterized protein LOC143568988 [Bidens hawaiensis]|uniref:uncharacterized protein LOC143568988 n=1 Tax=Bidens hawaiensis TaxID=980011 RepID=UPI0040491010